MVANDNNDDKRRQWQEPKLYHVTNGGEKELPFGCFDVNRTDFSIRTARLEP